MGDHDMNETLYEVAFSGQIQELEAGAFVGEKRRSR